MLTERKWRRLISDIDECVTNNFGCSHDCVNTPGSAYCVCPSGYSLVEGNKTCADVDECSDEKLPNFGCSHYCNNLAGSAECKCPAGYKLRNDQKTCKGNLFVSNQFSKIEKKVAIKKKKNNLYGLVSDIDECVKENGGCSHECINLKGGMRCACPDGYHLSETDAKTCRDINECQIDQEAELSCRASGGSCLNIPGSYQCVCPEGFRSIGTTCSG